MDNFEDKIADIDEVLSRKRNKWQASLSRLGYMDFDDVCQIIKRHIFIKIHLYDKERSFKVWVSKVADSQMKNIVRNNYGKFSPPCTGCDGNAGNGLCYLTKSGTQCAECPLFKRWENTKKDGYGIKFAASIDDVLSSGFNVESSDMFDMVKSIESFHEKMKEVLTPRLYMIYNILYIEQKGELYLSQVLGLTNNEKNSNSKRVPGYKQIYNYKEQIIAVAKKIILDFDIIR